MFRRVLTFVKIWRNMHRVVDRVDESLGRVLQRVERCGAVDDVQDVERGGGGQAVELPTIVPTMADDVQDVERGGGGQAVESPTIEPTMASPVEPKGPVSYTHLTLPTILRV